jgi:Zn-dependent protease with chaperone function
MPLARWVDLAAQAIFHTIVAALTVEALVRLWEVRRPDERLAMRALVLAWPLGALPLIAVLAPGRWGEAFRDGRALFAGRHWEEVRFLGIGLFQWWVGLHAAIGLGLFLMDFLPLVLSRRRPPGPAPPAGAEGQAVAAALEEIAGRMRQPVPPLAFLDRGGPLLFCAGARRATLVVSRAAAALLDPGELRAALAHELAHLNRLDPGVSWLLMGARALQCFNPAFQVVARAMAHDAEGRADERAAAATGDRLALASALLKLFRATEGRAAAPGRRSLPLAGALSEPIARARAREIETRCRRLLGPAPAPLAFGRLRLAATAASLTALLWFVV